MEPRTGGNGRGALRETILHGATVTSVLPTAHKQGYLRDLHQKSKPELIELLEKQKKMLLNRKFVERLPDKGEKIKKLVKTLQDIIAEKNVQIKSEDESKASNVTEKESGKTENKTDKEHAEQHLTKHEEELKIIERTFNQLSVHDGPYYQVVVKAEERTRKKSKFTLNRPRKNESKEPSPSKEESCHAKLVKPVELTSASTHDSELGPATVISVEECRTLYSSQQKKMQESRAELLTDRMMRRFNAGGTLEHPEGRYGLKDENIQREELLDPDQEYLDAVD